MELRRFRNEQWKLELWVQVDDLERGVIADIARTPSMRGRSTEMSRSDPVEDLRRRGAPEPAMGAAVSKVEQRELDLPLEIELQ